MKETSPPTSRPAKVTRRKLGKGLVGFYATEEEKAALQDAADSRGITVAELLRRIANGKIHLEDTES